jgi:hypothetical protein
VGDGEARSEVGVALGTSFHELPGMQETAVEGMNGVLDLRSEE